MQRLVVSTLAVAAAIAVLSAAPGAHAILMDKVLLSEALPNAMCLDGTAPAFYIHYASDAAAAKKWIIYLEGGGWCYDLEQCVGRAGTDLGSSKNYPPQFDPGYEGGAGLLSNDSSLNPDFWGWNFVYVRYCDGASYTGDVAEPVNYNGYDLHFRGRHNFNAVIEHLMRGMGLHEAEEAILAGCSAGGLGTYVHCDHFSHLLGHIPTACMPDAGFFVDVPSAGSPSGKEMIIRADYQNVFEMQNSTLGVATDCIRALPEREHWRCFFPQYTMHFTRTRTFILNSGYDSWQTNNIWFAASTMGGQPPPAWAECAGALQNCTAQQMPTVQHYHDLTLKALDVALDPNSPHGAFIDSCFVHCQTSWWNSGAVIGGRTMAQTAGDWYFKRQPASKSKSVMCPYPCNEPDSHC